MPAGVGRPPAGTEWGSPNLGGPIATAGGLVFIGATLDRKFRAFDIETGRVLWSADLPAGARATPMTYATSGRQFVAIAAGGGGRFGRGDAIVAFALPAPEPAAPFPGADHTFRLAPGPGGWPRTAPDYVTTLLDWLARR
jgi:hypothetical protein